MAKTPSAIELDMLKTKAEKKQAEERQQQATLRRFRAEATKPASKPSERSTLEQSTLRSSLSQSEPIKIQSSTEWWGRERTLLVEEEDDGALVGTSYCGHPTMFMMDSVTSSSADSKADSESASASAPNAHDKDELKSPPQESSLPIDIHPKPSDTLAFNRPDSIEEVDDEFLEDMFKVESNLLMLRNMLRNSQNSVSQHPLVGSYTSPRGEFVLSSFTPIEHTSAFVNKDDDGLEDDDASQELQFSSLFSPHS